MTTNDDPDVRREAAAPRAADPLREALKVVRRQNIALLRRQHEAACFDQGDHEDEVDTAFSMGADAIEQVAALAAAPQPAPVDRGMLVGVITEALYRHGDKGWTPSGSVNDIADALLAAGLRLPRAVQPDEMLAWAVIDDDGTPSLVNYDRLTAVHLAGHGEQVVRVAIRRVEDEA